MEDTTRDPASGSRPASSSNGSVDPAARPAAARTPDRALDPSASIGAQASAKDGAIEDWSLVALVVLSFAGFAVAGFSPKASFQYWLVIAPVFAVVSLYTAWSRARKQGRSASDILKLQALHWLVLPIAVYLIYRLELSGRLDSGDAGVVALLAIAITTYLAGVHFDWRLALVGAALGVGAFGAAIVADYFWIVGLCTMGLGGIVFWFRRKS